MKNKCILILAMLLLFQVVYINDYETVEAAAPTKPMTHIIEQSSWSNSKTEGPDYYDYDDGLWYGRLYKDNTIWDTRRTTTNNNRRRGSNNRSSLERDTPITPTYDENYYIELYESQGKDNIEILDIYWTGEVEGPGEFEFDSGSVYDYQRSFRVRYSYTQYKYTTHYSGTVTSRNAPPEIRLLTPSNINERHHNQNNIIVEGFVKDEDMGDINTIYYTIEGTSFDNKEVILTNRTEIIATANDEYFKGYIQLEQSISPGEYNLKIWAKDDKGADSDIIEIPIVVYNVLEDVLDSVRKYTLNEDKSQFIVINSNVPIYKSDINDNLIIEIKEELLNKNLLMYFIGNIDSKNYINPSLLGN